MTKLVIRQELDLGKAKKELDGLKTKMTPFGFTFAIQLVTKLPAHLVRLILDDASSRITLTFTNLNAYRKKFVFDGKKSLGQFYFVGGPGKMPMVSNISTVENDMGLVVAADKNAMKNPQTFVDIFVRKNKENIESFKNGVS